LETLFDAVEKYPELAESKRYLSLKEKIEDANVNILKAGKMYNSIVRMANQRIHAFPTKLVAKLFGFKEHPML
jgi:LemA protein